jgi:glycosyltransferase involved in cell wall biosynthesis
MAVRVRITDGGRSVVVKVLVNGGAESDEPLVVVDPDIASKIGIPGEELDVVEGTEWLPREKLIGLLQSSYSVVISPLWEEPFGIVALEAMAAGSPW